VQLPTAFEGGVITVKHEVRQDLNLVEACIEYVSIEQTFFVFSGCTEDVRLQ
jgi:ribosomal protein L19